MKEIDLTKKLALYEAPDEVKRELGRVTLYAFVGPTGSGKDSIMDKLQDLMPYRFERVVGDTSREPRAGEKNKVTYNFRKKGAMVRDLQAEKFVQVAPGSVGDFYATRPGQYPTDKLAMFAVQARVLDKFRSLGFKEVKRLQIVPHSHEAWQEWHNSREFSKEDEAARIEEAIASYSSALVDQQTYWVLNDKIEDAAKRVIRISSGKRPTDESRAKTVAHNNLKALQAYGKS